MTEKTSDSGKTDLSMDTMAEDLFGLNIRGVRTLGTIWVHPRRYFQAAKAQDWEDKYTPSIRLWLSFFALFSALKVWWGSHNDGLIEAYAAGYAQAGLPLPQGMTYEDIGTEAILWVFSLWPVLEIVSMILLSLVYPFWGERTSVSLRQRYLFAVIVPNASLMPLYLIVMMFVPAGMQALYALMLAPVTLLINFQTGYRGAFGQVSGMGRVWRAGLLALTVVMLSVVMSLIATVVGIMVISQKYGFGLAG